MITQIKEILLYAVIFLTGCTAQTPAVLYELDYTPSVDLETGFVTPPDYAKAGAFWMWLEGNASKEGILSDLTEMKKSGINNPTVFDASVCPGTAYGTLTERPAAGPVFMSSEWRELFVYTCRIADSLDMDISLNICSGWNSGGAWVTPEHAAKKIAWSEIVVNGPKQISEQLPLPKGLLTDERTGKPFYEPVAVLALKLADNSDSVRPLENFNLKAIHSINLPNTKNGLGYDWASLLKEEPERENDCHAYLKNVTDITGKTDAEGRLTWDAPEGRYLIMRFVYTGTGIRVSSHSPGGGGLVIDYLNREAMKMYYDRTVKPVLDDLKNAGIRNPKYLFEDSWELNAVNWTKGFEQHFKKAHGYDITPYLPVIAGRVIENRKTSNKFLSDFRRTTGDLIWENHYKYVKELSHNDGLGYHPESGGPHPAPLDALKNEGQNDIPMGEFWLRSSTHRVTPDKRFYVKQPASAAHIYGKRFVAAEGLTSIGPHWEEDFAYMKPTLDRAYCEGLNHLVICTFSHSPKDAGKPGTEFFAGTHFNPNVTWWKQAPAFLEWSSRCSFMLSQGLFVGDVCYYYGDNVPNQVPMKHVNDDPGEGYDYDVCNTEVILDRMSVHDGKIVLPDGMSYHVLALPEHNAISPEAAKKIKSMKKAGATIIDLHAGENIRDALLKKGVIPDFIYESRKPNALIDYIHRTTDSAEIYYVVNRHEQPEYLRVSFRVEGKMPELWHPETGKTNEYPVYQTAAGRTTLPLFLEPFGSVFVVFRKPANAYYKSLSLNGKNIFPELPQDTFDVQPFVFQKDGKLLPLLAGAWTLISSDGKTQMFATGIETLPVASGWEVSFDTAWGGPEKVRFDKLILWNEHPDDGIRYYSGTAEYTTAFHLTAGQRCNKRICLDLGELYNLAEIHINGQPAGVWWQPPFSQDITDLLKDGENTLQIQVVNLWPNRLIGDQFLPEEKRFTKTNIRKFKKEHPLRPSGLAGPVTIRIIENELKPTAEQVRQDRARGIVLPESDVHYKAVKSYVEDEPDADYIHASEAAYEAFRDIKFSIRIHWGVYSKWGIEASIPYPGMSKEKKMEYNELYKTFNPEGFDAQEWMSFFKRCGMQAFAFTTKHCDGFSMFHTKTRVQRRINYLDTENHPVESCNLAYSIEESPFKRDIVKELCDAAHKNGIKINLYYSHPDWYDADFRPYLDHPATKLQSVPAPTPEEQSAMVTRHREQLRELLANYGKVDMVCLDMWLGKPVWAEIKKTVKMMRQLQPDVMIRARGIGNYGDYYQPEQDYSAPPVPGDKDFTNMPWMMIRTLGNIFAYDSVAGHYKGTQWVISHLVDCVAKGGSFMVCVGPDANGKFHPEAVRQLEAVGEWLKVNGEGIYKTRNRDVWKSGDIRFTRSKDNKQVYAFVEKFPDKELIIPSVTPKKRSKVRLLGYSKPLKWESTGDGGIKIKIPDALQSPENRPCEYAWTFKIEN